MKGFGDYEIEAGFFTLPVPASRCAVGRCWRSAKKRKGSDNGRTLEKITYPPMYTHRMARDYRPRVINSFSLVFTFFRSFIHLDFNINSFFQKIHSTEIKESMNSNTDFLKIINEVENLRVLFIKYCQQYQRYSFSKAKG